MEQTRLLGERGFPRPVTQLTLPQQGARSDVRQTTDFLPTGTTLRPKSSHAAPSSLYGHRISHLKTEGNGNLKMSHMLQALWWLIRGFLIKCLLNSNVIFGRPQWPAARSKT
jgi:hypothetical protein